MAPLADVYARLRMDTTSVKTDAAKGFSGAGFDKMGADHGKAFGSSFAKTAGTLIASVGSLLAVGGAVNFLKDSIDEAREAVRVGNLTEAAIKSTGGAAHITAGQVSDLANAMSLKLGVDDEVIQSGENLLLTFTRIRNETGKGNDIFNQASVAIDDMTAAMNNGQITAEGLHASTIQVGKALNDPIKGMTALSKVGVTFTAQQKEQIKNFVESGNIMGAQKVILAELATEFGGAGAAAADPAKRAAVAWANFKEQIGGFVLPILATLGAFLTGTILPVVQNQIIPAIRDLAGWFQLGFLDGASHVSGLAGVMQILGAAVRGVWDWVRSTGIPAARDLFAVISGGITTVAGIVGWFNEHRKTAIALAAVLGTLLAIYEITTAVQAIQSVGLIAYLGLTNAVRIATVTWTGVQWLLNLALDANPIGIIIVVIAALVAAFVLAWQHSATFRDIVIGTWQGIQTVIMFAWNNVIKPVVDAFVWFWRNILGPTVMWLWHNVIEPAWQGISFAFSIAWAVASVIFGLMQIAIKLAGAGFLWLWQNVVYPAWQAIQLIIGAAWAVIRPILAAAEWFIRNVLAPVFTWLWHNVIEPVFKGIGDTIGFVWNNVLKPVFNALGRFITDTVEPAFHAGVDALGRAWHGLLEMAKAPVKFIINTVLNDGLLGAYNWIANKFGVKPDDVHVKLPAGFAEGGWTGPGGKYEPAGVVHADEFVIPKESVRRHGVAHFMQYLPPYADGGLVGAIKGAWNAITDPVKWLKDKALGLLDNIPGGRWIADQVIGVGRSLIGGAVNWLKEHMASLLGGGSGNWPSSPAAQRGDSGVWRGIVSLIQSTGPISGTFGNAYRAGDPLWHGSGRAVDWMGYNQDALANFFMQRIGSVLELIHRTGTRDYAVTRGVNKGSFNNALMEQHRNHLHIAMDSGYGVLAPGRNIVDNGTGRAEAIAAVGTGRPAVVELSDTTIEKLGRAIGRELNGVGSRVVQTARAY